MNKILILLLFSFGYLWADSEGVGAVQPNSAESKQTSNVLEVEKSLNDILLGVNKTFESHSKIMVMKIRVLPKNVTAYKGIADGDKCKKADNQEDGNNNCLHVEYYDFIGPDEGKEVTGAKSKAVTIFFEGAASGNDPKLEKDRKVSKVKSRIIVEDFARLDKRTLEIVDYDPSSKEHDEKIALFLQIDDYPAANATQSLSDKGYGKYTAATIENSESHPVRNKFKRDAYIKHLHFFERLFSKIYFYNDKNGNVEHNKQMKFLETNLKY